MRKLIIFLIILAGLIYAIGLSTKGSQDIKSTTYFYTGVKGTDTLKAVTPDTLKKYLRSQGFTDSCSIADSIAAIKIRTSQQIHDSLGQAKVVIPYDLRVGSEITLSDTLQINTSKFWNTNGTTLTNNNIETPGTVTGLNITATANLNGVDANISGSAGVGNNLNVEDSLKIGVNATNRSVLSSSTNGQGVEYPATLKIDSAYVDIKSGKLTLNSAIIEYSAGELILDANDVEIGGNVLSYDNGASIQNPSAGLLTINSTNTSITSDSTDVNAVLNFDSLKNQSGFKLYNSHADTTYYEETAFKFKGNLKVKGLLELTNGTTTTFTQAPNRLTISGGDSLSIRNMTNINPYRATSPQTSTFIGMLAGKVGTTGANNVVMGYQAGDNITSGHSNILIGSQVGGITTAITNTLIGNEAGKTTNSEGNTTVGHQSMMLNINGSFNTNVGRASFYSGTGSRNNFFGYGAGNGVSGQSTGSNNIGIGTLAYRGYTTASYGVALGDSSGFRNTIGSNNIFLGYKSGGNNTTGNRNMFLGDFKGFTSPDSMLYIDNTGKDSTATPLITGNMGSATYSRGVTVDGDFTFKLLHAYISFADSTRLINLTQNVYSMITNSNRNLLLEMEDNYALVQGDSITVKKAGSYEITGYLSFITSSPSDTYRFRLYKNGVAYGTDEVITSTSNNNRFPMPMFRYIDNAAVGDDFHFRVTNTADNNDITIKGAKILFKKLY